ncbi:hypothetical protein IscW_ISCW022964, partial [Ixodes scapularis]
DSAFRNSVDFDLHGAYESDGTGTSLLVPRLRSLDDRAYFQVRSDTTVLCPQRTKDFPKLYGSFSSGRGKLDTE